MWMGERKVEAFVTRRVLSTEVSCIFCGQPLHSPTGLPLLRPRPSLPLPGSILGEGARLCMSIGEFAPSVPNCIALGEVVKCSSLQLFESLISE